MVCDNSFEDSFVDRYTPWGSAKKQGLTRLHFAMKSRAPVDHIQILLRRHPQDAIAQETENLMTPLHVGLKEYGYNPGAIKALVEACPEACSMTAKTEKLPLHYAFEFDSCAGAVEAVLLAFPDASDKVDETGRTPLHLAIIRSSREESIQVLLKRHPHVAKTTFKSWTPLHWAMSCRTQPSIVEALLSAYPEAVAHKDSDGRTPLHVAMAMNAAVESTKALVDHTPSIAQVKDHEGWLPLHHGMRYLAAEEACELVRKAYPGAVTYENGDGSKPYEMITRTRNVRRGYRVKNS